MTVQTILTRKGSTVYTIEPTASIAYATKSLADHGIGALVVTGADGRTVGIISERDIVRALSAKGGAALETPVAEIMTRKVVTCSRQDKLVDLMQRMTEGKFRHFPVIEDQRLAGIVSIGDVVMPPGIGTFEPPESGSECLFLALGSVANHTGEQAGALLTIVQSLARDRLISMTDAKKLVRLLSAESPEAQRRVTAQSVRRKATPIRLPTTPTRRP